VSTERKGRRILPIIHRCYHCREVHRTLNYKGVNICLACMMATVEACRKALESIGSTEHK